ncbi:MAG: NAD(P)-binding domain-containing protein, partial [Planctomycetes bacterium]|nr:NAD(P)-binding domain-containing protein [Planctomycetota bacterium]
MPTTAVIGTGSWGTAAAVMAARNGDEVVLVGRDPDKIARLERTRQHEDLAGSVLPRSIRCTADPSVLGTADLVLWAVPT